MSSDKHTLGILGGMGPEATSVLYKRITDRTVVSCDQEHINILIYSHAALPDRTGCILCGEGEKLWEQLAADVRMLRSAGCEYLAVPCNTCHYFAERFQQEFYANPDLHQSGSKTENELDQISQMIENLKKNNH